MAMNKHNENGTNLAAGNTNPEAKQTLLTCKNCGETEMYMTSQLEGKSVWTCGGCSQQNSLPGTVSAKLNKYRMTLTVEGEGPYIITAHTVNRSDGFFEFLIDNKIFYAVNQGDVLALYALDHEGSVELDC